MTDLFQTLALRGAGLTPSAGLLPAQPRQRARFEPEGFAAEYREVPAASETDARSTTVVEAHDPGAPEQPSLAAIAETEAPDTAEQPHGKTVGHPRLSRPAQTEANSRAEEANRASTDARPPHPQPRETRPAVPPTAQPDLTVSEGELPPPSASETTPRDAETIDVNRIPREPDRHDATALPSNRSVRHQSAQQEEPASRDGVLIDAHSDSRNAQDVTRMPGAVSSLRSGEERLSLERQRPTVSVSIGRIEVEVTPRPVPQSASSRPQVQRTRGFEGYGRARHGQPR